MGEGENSKQKYSGGWVGGVRVDVNQELKFLLKSKKNRGVRLRGGRVGGVQGGCEH